MSDDETNSAESGQPTANGGEGLFSQLPRTRPGVRSPRALLGPARAPLSRIRQSAQAAAKAAQSLRRRRLAEPAPRLRPLLRRLMPPPEPEPEPQAGDRRGPAGLEDLAWAGIAVTAEAATLGVRLLGRAFDAARRAAERG